MDPLFEKVQVVTNNILYFQKSLQSEANRFEWYQNQIKDLPFKDESLTGQAHLMSDNIHCFFNKTYIQD